MPAMSSAATTLAKRRATIMVPTSIEGERGIEEHMIPLEVDMTVHTPVRRQSRVVVVDDRTWREKFTTFLKITLPHVGLVALLTGYTIVGAAIFHSTENPHEMKVERVRMQQIRFMRRHFIDYMWNLSQADDVTADYWAKSADLELQKLTRTLYDAFENDYITLGDILNDTHHTVWTVPQAIFFATTVITTIGYGNLVPRTVSGRIWCIVYSVFGIPLMLITIADIGKFFSDLITFIYRHYRAFKAQLRTRWRFLAFVRRRRKSGSKNSQKSASSASVEKNAKSDEVHLPAVMAIVVIVVYTAIGGLLFQMWEGWEYFDAFYFCFITMVTIGFGDIVPSEEVYLLFTIIYIVIGLSITTMCIDLAGSEYITKLHYFGQKIGTAKDVVGGAVVSGLHAGENLLKHSGFVRTAAGHFVPITDTCLLNALERTAMRRRCGLASQTDCGIFAADLLLEDLLAETLNAASVDQLHSHNLLFVPPSDKVRKVLKPNMGLLPQEISEDDAYVVENKISGLPLERLPMSNKRRRKSGRVRYLPRTSSWPRKEETAPLLIAPFLLKESEI